MYNSILIPFAPDHGDVSANAMAVARKLLTAGGHITVLTVIDAIPTYVSQYLPQDQQDKNKLEVRKALEAEFSGHPDVSVAVKIGHPAQVILDMAQDGAHDCVIIASHRPGLQDYFLGSTAARVVRHAQCGVHVLR